MKTTVLMEERLPNYILEVKFSNGEIKDFDVKPYQKGDWYGELKDPNVFTNVKVGGLSIEWLGGQDICPNELYYNSKHKIGA